MAKVERMLTAAAPRKLAGARAIRRSPGSSPGNGSTMRSPRLAALENRARAETAAAAHRDQRALGVGSFELVQRGGNEPGPGRANRMPERDRAAVDVHALHVGLELALPREHD